jgi:PAS domain S-box-containing protein
MPTLCWMARANGWIYWYNRRWYEYTGTTAEQMEGWGWQSVHDPVVLPEVLDNWKNCIALGQPFEMTFPLKSASGEFRPFLTRVTPIFDDQGMVTKWLGTNTDIGSERRALELREEFMAILGHDLRNPLTGIGAGLTQLLKTPLNDRAITLTHMMQASAARMQGLVNDLMDLAKARLGDGISLQLAPSTLLKEVLQSVVDELQSGSPDRQIECHFDIPQTLNCDPSRLAQLLSNLLANALTYGSPNEPVRVEARHEDRTFLLSVANAGNPIPQEDRERLFQPFYRGAVRSSRQGLGLGLYIACQIALGHGGDLAVESDEHETTFSFSMPLTQ